MWQKVKIVASEDKRYLGRFAWADPKTIETCAVDRVRNGQSYTAGKQRVVNINVFAPDPLPHDLLAPSIEMLEFLPEFIENAPLLEYSEWLGAV